MVQLTVGLVAPSTDYYFISPPLYFVRSGEVYINNGYSWDMGAKNYAWSQTASKTLTNAYYFYFNNSEVSTSYGPGYRWDGFPLHCLSLPFFPLYTSCTASILSSMKQI